VSDALAADHKASRAEVLVHAPDIRQLAADLGLDPVRVRDDGTVVIHSPDPGYRTANRLSTSASRVVGTYVHVITDDAPGAASAREL
jgi:hydrogenase maturation factor